jgi:hypothetical protein
MTIIRIRTIQIKNKEARWGWDDFKQVLRYLVDLKSFTMTLPPSWAEVLQQKEVHGETEEMCDRAWEEAKKKVEELSITQRKVICYFFEANVYECECDEKGTPTKCIIRLDEMSFTKGTALDFTFCVCNESTSTLLKEKMYYTLSGSYYEREGGEKAQHIINWTPEREMFFSEFQGQLVQLIKKIHNFTNLPVETVGALIEKYKTISALPYISKDGVNET